jgi:hypothetical protein
MPSRQNNQAQPADAIAMLKADHQRVRDLFAQYDAADNVETKRMLAEQVFTELEMHAQLEENVFYPAVNEETEEGPELGRVDEFEVFPTKSVGYRKANFSLNASKINVLLLIRQHALVSVE